MNHSSILIYSQRQCTQRLEYVLHWIFKEQFNCDYQVCDDEEKFQLYEGPKINYSDQDFSDSFNNTLRIKPSNLLFETGIKSQNLSIQRWKRLTVLFYNQPGQKITFDIFAAVFYLISRYEEYLPHEVDFHGRYSSKESAAGQYGFLNQPIIDLWLFHFKNILATEFQLELTKKPFQVIHTFDVDMAWKYLNKGFKRTYGGYLRDFLTFNFAEIRERMLVLKGKNADPFFSFENLKLLQKQYHFDPIYFFLLADELSQYDKNTSPSHPSMQQLIKSVSHHAHCGIHPSYNSHKDDQTLKNEIEYLSSCLQQSIKKSRQHFIKFKLPETYRTLIQNGIQEDYSMGYANENGFRAGTSHSFLWYDLLEEKVSTLRIFPFAFMDATSKFYLKRNQLEVVEDWKRIYNQLRSVDGCLINIWHNYILSQKTDKNSWLDVFEQILNFQNQSK